MSPDKFVEFRTRTVSLVVGGVLLFWPSTSARTLLMVFGGWALFTGVSQILAARRANVEDTDRGLIPLWAEQWQESAWYY